MRRLSLIFAAAMAAACGTKGPLTLPPKTLPAAAPKAPAKPVAPAAAPEEAPADNSSKAPAETRQ